MRTQITNNLTNEGENVCLENLNAGSQLMHVLDKFIFMNENYPYRSNLGTLFKCAMESETMDDKGTRIDVTNFIDDIENICFMIHQFRDLIKGGNLILLDGCQNLVDSQTQANLILSSMPIFANKN